MTADRFIALFRVAGGDVFRVGDSVVLDGPSALLQAVRCRAREIGKSALFAALTREREAAVERLRLHGLPTVRSQRDERRC